MLPEQQILRCSHTIVIHTPDTCMPVCSNTHTCMPVCSNTHTCMLQYTYLYACMLQYTYMYLYACMLQYTYLYAPVSTAWNSVLDDAGPIPICTKISLCVRMTRLAQSLRDLVFYILHTDFGLLSFRRSLESKVGVVNLYWVEPRLPGCHDPVIYKTIQTAVMHAALRCIY